MRAVFTCRAFGFEWEHRFVAMANERGHRAVRAQKLKPYDAVVNGLKVQCKRKDYQDPCGGIRVAKGQKRYARDDYDVLALNFRERLFFIPSWRLVMPSGTLATKIFAEKFTQYENNWAVFSGAGECTESDQKTFW